MEQKLTSRWLIIKLTGILFAAYAAYNIFILIRDRSMLPSEGKLITAVVALLFAVLAAFAFTSEAKRIRFLKIRKAVFIVTMLAIFLLKLRMARQVIEYLDPSKSYTVLYGASYFMTLTGLLLLCIYYAFILDGLPFHPKVYALLPILAVILFSGSLILEAILFFAYGFGVEENLLRTAVIRPVFYLSFIGLSAYFLFPARLLKKR